MLKEVNVSSWTLPRNSAVYQCKWTLHTKSSSHVSSFFLWHIDYTKIITCKRTFNLFISILLPLSPIFELPNLQKSWYYNIPPLNYLSSSLLSFTPGFRLTKERSKALPRIRLLLLLTSPVVLFPIPSITLPFLGDYVLPILGSPEH